MIKVIVILLVIISLGIVAYFVSNYWIMRNVKTPSYQVISKQGNIEVREYAPMLIAQVRVSGERNQATSQGFRLLADYIFGNNQAIKGGAEKIAMTAPVIQQKEKIAMTAPVMQTAIGDKQWLVSFVMPKQYTLATLPKPNNAQVKIIAVKAHKAVAIRFSGRARAKKLSLYEKELRDYIAKQHLAIKEPPEYAYYNPPWTLPILRRNEIIFSLVN